MGIFGAMRCVVRVVRNRGYEKRCHGRVIKMLSFELLSIYCIRNDCMFNDLVMWCAECTWFVFTTSGSSRTSIDRLGLSFVGRRPRFVYGHCVNYM